MEYSVSKIVAQKKRYIFRIIIAVFVLIAITMSIVGSFSLYQYNFTKENFVDNQVAKMIEISSYNNHSNEVRKLNNNDVSKINRLLTNMNLKNELIIEYQINFGILTDTGRSVFIKSFSNNFLTENMFKHEALITKSDFNSEKLVLNIPVIEVKNNGYVSNTSVKKCYNLIKLDDSSRLNRYVKSDEVIAPEEEFYKIIKIMFPKRENFDIEKIYVEIEEIDKIKKVANFLTSKNYNVHHAFEYCNDLDSNVENVVRLSLIIMILLLVFTLSLLIGLFELMLKNSVGDIAVLKHLGYKQKSIKKNIYPMILNITFAIIVITIFFGIITLILMALRVDFYSKKRYTYFGKSI